jgi:hypothetical protein
MRDESGRRLSMAVIFHRPQSVRLWFSSRSSRKKKDGHISSLSIDQLLKTKVAIRAKVVPAVERWLDKAVDFDEEIHLSKSVEEQGIRIPRIANNPPSHALVPQIPFILDRTNPNQNVTSRFHGQPNGKEVCN